MQLPLGFYSAGDCEERQLDFYNMGQTGCKDINLKIRFGTNRDTGLVAGSLGAIKSDYGSRRIYFKYRKNKKQQEMGIIINVASLALILCPIMVSHTAAKQSATWGVNFNFKPASLDRSKGFRVCGGFFCSFFFSQLVRSVTPIPLFKSNLIGIEAQETRKLNDALTG